MADGWQQLLPPAEHYLGTGRYPIDAYSEFMPPPRLAWKPYRGAVCTTQLLDVEDPWGWYVSEIEEANELQPGMEQVAKQVVGRLWHLLRGNQAHAISRRILADNLYWPAALQEHAGKLAHDRCVVFVPLALSRTQDDKGRVCWTLFGCSEQGPAKAFWKSFALAPDTPAPPDGGVRFFCHLLRTVYQEAVETIGDLQKVGLRLLLDDQPPFAWWQADPPAWTKPLQMTGEEYAEAKYLITFRPFEKLPAKARDAYLAGTLHLLPSPASLVFWGAPRIHRLFDELPLGLQAPLLQAVTRKRGPGGLRVPQAGLLHEAGAHGAKVANPELVRNTFKRTHRWDRVLRNQDELALLDHEDKLLHVLFSSIPDDMGLYDKPMARNVQIWTSDGALLLDGPSASPEEIRHAMRTTEAGGVFGYRFVFPAMRVGTHEIYWHRPLVAYHCPTTDRPIMLTDAPLGYLTAYETAGGLEAGTVSAEEAFRAAFRPTTAALQKPVEMYPRLHRRPLPLATLPLCHQAGRAPTTGRNLRKLFDAYHLRNNRPLPRGFARQLLTLPRDESLTQWLESLHNIGMATSVAALLEPETADPPAVGSAKPAMGWTFSKTAKRTFEVAYWKTIALLAEGQFLNKNNADCIRDAVTQSLLSVPGRQLDALGDYLLDYYGKRIAAAKMTGQALAGSLPFRWSTDFDYSWMGGWLKNKDEQAERNLLVVIPGQDRSRAVIMADHYDTAYMADRYEPEYGGRGARISACGADDNHSATAALMLAAPIFLEMSKKGKLGCDVWLIHLTGEEFPADCLGARHLTQALVEKRLTLHLDDEKTVDLSGVEIQGVYVSDMIAHNNDHDRDVFQMAPGTGAASLWLAEQAAAATATWNAAVPAWNQGAERKGLGRGRRSPYGNAVPGIASHLSLDGQVRPVSDPRSTLYNTDGQVFSDAGVPVVLFMENYDINRSGYHDTHDTMANIDLDYGAALAAIVIESVARAANGRRE